MAPKYYMECGCTHTREDLKQTKQGLVCPEHKETFNHGQITCIDCGAARIIKTMRFVSRVVRCVRCQADRSDKNTKKRNATIRAKEKGYSRVDISSKRIPARLADLSRSDCRKRHHCWEIISQWFPYSAAYPCKGCPDYKGGRELNVHIPATSGR